MSAFNEDSCPHLTNGENIKADYSEKNSGNECFLNDKYANKDKRILSKESGSRFSSKREDPTDKEDDRSLGGERFDTADKLERSSTQEDGRFALRNEHLAENDPLGCSAKDDCQSPNKNEGFNFVEKQKRARSPEKDDMDYLWKPSGKPSGKRRLLRDLSIIVQHNAARRDEDVSTIEQNGLHENTNSEDGNDPSNVENIDRSPSGVECSLPSALHKDVQNDIHSRNEPLCTTGVNGGDPGIDIGNGGCESDPPRLTPNLDEPA